MSGEKYTPQLPAEGSPNERVVLKAKDLPPELGVNLQSPETGVGGIPTTVETDPALKAAALEKAKTEAVRLEKKVNQEAAKNIFGPKIAGYLAEGNIEGAKNNLFIFLLQKKEFSNLGDLKNTLTDLANTTMPREFTTADIQAGAQPALEYTLQTMAIVGGNEESVSVDVTVRTVGEKSVLGISRVDIDQKVN